MYDTMVYNLKAASARKNFFAKIYILLYIINLFIE